MFEHFSRDRRRAPQRSMVPVLISTAAHIIVAGVIAAIPILYVSAAPPEVPHVLAFVASPPPPPPPPPPPAPAPTPAKTQVTRSVPVRSQRTAPVEAPRTIVAERQVEAARSPGLPGGIEGSVPGGVPGGVVGGVPGGVVGGVVGGVFSDLPAPPPPPSVPVARAPVRVGGDVKAPALIERVQPEYPEIARRARVEGVVILEAVVDRQGRVEEVRVLRSIPLLDRAAVDAVRHWRYSPLLVSGQPESFIVTVTINFSVSSEGL